MPDKQTITAYDSRADEYSRVFEPSDTDPAFLRFIEMLPAGASVLDLGCGPGKQAAAMHARGFAVTATDASTAMVEMAKRHGGFDVFQATFDDLKVQDTYDGIWAHFSLLHAPRGALPDHLAQIATALVPGGIFHLGMKTGTGERRDRLGRYYTFYTVDELHRYLEAANFDVIEKITGEGAGLAGTIDPWVEILASLNR